MIYEAYKWNYFAENESAHKLSGIHLNIYHVRRHDSSVTPKSPVAILSEILATDEERVKALHSRLANKKSDTATASSSSSSHQHKQGVAKPIGIPLKPGLSIGSGNYYVKVGLGSPVKYYSMIMDTGSSFSWLQCQPCTVYCYSQIDPLFDPSASKTYRKLSCSTSECSSIKQATLNDPFCQAKSNTCIYTASYGDTSFSVGSLSQDILTLTPSESLPRFIYGCGQDNQGLFGRAAGILGLAQDKLSMLAQLSNKYGYAFSYCLPTALPISTRGGQGGFLSIGNISLSPSSAYKFTPMIKSSFNPSLYFLSLTAITVANKPLGVAAAKYKVPTIIDSGTVITRLPAPVYAALRQAFIKIMSNKYAQAPEFSILDTCFKASLGRALAVPQIRLVFQGGADLSLGTHNILVEADKGVVCLAFAPSSGTNQIGIIGNHQQQTFKVAYDVSKSRIGFAAGGCH